MINKNKETKREILLSTVLTSKNTTEESARIFVKFCNEHPEYNTDDIHIEIQDLCAVIYRERMETDDELVTRVESEYNEIVTECLRRTKKPINGAIARLIGYGDEADNKTREINHLIKQELAKLL